MADNNEGPVRAPDSPAPEMVTVPRHEWDQMRREIQQMAEKNNTVSEENHRLQKLLHEALNRIENLEKLRDSANKNGTLLSVQTEAIQCAETTPTEGRTHTRADLSQRQQERISGGTTNNVGTGQINANNTRGTKLNWAEITKLHRPITQ